ncbi:MAG TPA: nuclear transport factor 2 family protein [Candidatus Aminicenantes bacterium]|nr:nuclear transport factor 2 family protein [Candidatus Aminicenantes bacterium]
MKPLLLLLVLLSWPCLAAGSGESPAVREIDAMLTAWHHAAAVADATTYFGSMTADSVFLGTDPGERWTRKEFEEWASPYFMRGLAWEFTARQRSIRLAAGGRLAWFDELLDSKSYWLCRGSGVVVRQGSRWFIAQYILSFTIPNAATREIQPIVERALGKEK